MGRAINPLTFPTFCRSRLRTLATTATSCKILTRDVPARLAGSQTSHRVATLTRFQRVVDIPPKTISPLARR